jgi:hypothetical protein
MKWPWQRAEIQLDQPADVFWIAGGGQRQSFTSVTNAVRFVMEELPEPHREYPPGLRPRIDQSRANRLYSFTRSGDAGS